MDRKKIEELIRLVEDSEIRELEVSGLFGSIRVVKSHAADASPEVTALGPVQRPVAGTAAETSAADKADVDDPDSGLVPISSPMVGTFYEAPSPESAPYVRQGDRVNKGQVVCIVEAMKLVNEIESEVSGTIVRVMVENAQPVEFGQTLFMVDPD